MAEKPPKLKLITSEVDPDLAEVKRYVKARIAEGAFAVLLAAILALLACQFAGSRDRVAGVFFSLKGPPDFQAQGTTWAGWA
jgi:hypothetical protein